jgi:hypothetical protein
VREREHFFCTLSLIYLIGSKVLVKTISDDIK